MGKHSKEYLEILKVQVKELRQYNIAQGVCSRGKHHGAPKEGRKECSSCLSKKHRTKEQRIAEGITTKQDFWDSLQDLWIIWGKDLNAK
jgi:hypothetical protein